MPNNAGLNSSKVRKKEASMKKYQWFVVVPILILCGCATARMYPVQGPLSFQQPPLVYRAKINATFYSGTFSTTLNDGENFRVPISVVHNADRSQQDLSAEWDSVFGPGYYKNKVLDAQFHLRGAASGSKGRVLQVELYKNEIRPIPAVQNDDSSVIEMNGIAKDDTGNIYKVVFR